MTIPATLEHSIWHERIYSTSFYGEREALERSDFLRPLLPPMGRKYITLHEALFDGYLISDCIKSCNRKHGGVRIHVRWSVGWYQDARIPTNEEIIAISRCVLAEIQDQRQGRINVAPVGWPFPVWRIAA